MNYSMCWQTRVHCSFASVEQPLHNIFRVLVFLANSDAPKSFQYIHWFCIFVNGSIFTFVECRWCQLWQNINKIDGRFDSVDSTGFVEIVLIQMRYNSWFVGTSCTVQLRRTLERNLFEWNSIEIFIHYYVLIENILLIRLIRKWWTYVFNCNGQ